MFQMQTSICIMLLLSSGAISAGLEKVLPLTELIADIYHQFERGCIFLMTSRVQQQGFEAKILMQKIRKHLLYEYIPIMDTVFRTGVSRRCSTQRSIYVVLKGDAETRNYIHQSFLKTHSSRAIWLLFLDKNSSLEEFFTDINIPFDCEFLVAQPEDDHAVGLTEVYRVSPTLPLQTYRFGNWTPARSPTWPSTNFLLRRSNLQGCVIRATYKHEYLVVNIVNNSDGSEVAEGYFGQMWTTMAEEINAITVYHETESYGSKSANGSWSGMIALVKNREADIGIGDFTATSERSNVVDFIDTVEFSSTRVFIRIPNSADMSWNLYLAPFSYGLWLAVAIACCALSVCLAVTNISYDGQKRNPTLSVVAIFFYILGCLCQQGQRDAVNNTAGRIVTLTSYVMSLVIFAGYSASLISSLAVQPRALPFRDLQGLLSDGSYRLGVQENSAVLNIFDGAVEGVENEVYKKLIAPFTNDIPRDDSEGFKKVCTLHKYAYAGSYFVSQQYKGATLCQMTTLPGTSYPEPLTYIISKKSPYKYLINWKLAQLREKGIQSRIRQHYITSKASYVNRSATTVNLAAVAPILVVFVAGNLIAIFLLVIERQIHGNLFKCWPVGNSRRPENNECRKRYSNRLLSLSHKNVYRPPLYRNIHRSIRKHKCK
ncbi:probable glutamate receptor [Zootermopsis nevadensis]|nr:probable glutamate receptor [Zootermopsis nevadensis]